MLNLIPWKKRTTGELREWDDSDLFSVARLRNEVDALWDRFVADWDRGVGRWYDELNFGMKSSFEDNPDEYMFRAELPGFDTDEIDVQVSGNTLAIKAEHKDEKKSDAGMSYRSSSFQRYLTLPPGVDVDNIAANYHSGILEVHLPKNEEVKGKRIPINAGERIERS